MTNTTSNLLPKYVLSRKHRMLHRSYNYFHITELNDDLIPVVTRNSITRAVYAMRLPGDTENYLNQVVNLIESSLKGGTVTTWIEKKPTSD